MSKFGCKPQKNFFTQPPNANNANSVKKNNNAKKTNNKKNVIKQVDLYLTDNERLPLQQKIRDFMYSNENEMILQGLTKSHRKYLHEYAPRLGLTTRSFGNLANRTLHIYKKKRLPVMSDARTLALAPSTIAVLYSLIPKVQEQLTNCNTSNNGDGSSNGGSNGSGNDAASGVAISSIGNRSRGNNTTNRIMRGEALTLLGPRVVPPMPQRIPNELLRDKRELPIYRYQNEIHEILQHHNVFIINGETGSGKTTQVPQYILSEATRHNQPCRIVVTQPRRVAAVSVAHRVAEERGENLGDTVGYQIRMESRVRKNTNLIYTTSGCFLRSIMANVDDLFRKVSHLIIDEIHERDKNTDFTLITVKEHLKCNKNVKVILMSATMDIESLSKYFDDCPILNVPGQSYDIKIYHLDDILFHTGYRTALMEKYLRSLDDMQLQNVSSSSSLMMGNHTDNMNLMPDRLDDSMQTVFDVLVAHCCSDNSSRDDIKEYFEQMQYYIESEGMPINVGHSVTGITPLMAACKCNMPDYVRFFIHHGANIGIRDNDGYEAVDYARLHGDNICLQILTSSFNNMQQQQLHQDLSQQDREKQRLLSAYQMQFNDDNDVDHDLILSLLEGLYRSVYPGAIMVFLPGYNDIVKQRDLIQSTLPIGTYIICILHGQMDSKDQFDALQSHPVRKIILSTNIGQTSITIPDLAYVIDSGKVKMNTFDTITESSQLQCVWISQADACQRSGRAGRTQNGICYRLYSQMKYCAMSRFSIPEFMRIPLTEICLYAKVLDPGRKIQDYLARALSPPSTLSVQNALKKLNILGVLNNDESVTELGKHLVDIPLDVQLGKCLLYAVFLKCFDPILTICAYHSVKDPFILPTERSAQGQASFLRKSFAGDSFSDQMGILNLYKQYVAVRYAPHKVRDFCNKYYVSQSSMEMFCATRKQIGELMKQKFPDCRMHHDYNCNNWDMIQMCLVAGFYPNVVAVDRTNFKLICGAEKQLVLQRTSALTPPGKKHLKEFVNKLPHDWIVFYEKSRNANLCSINMNTVVPSLLIALQCGRSCKIEYDFSETDSYDSTDDNDDDANEDNDHDHNHDNDNGDNGVNDDCDKDDDVDVGIKANGDDNGINNLDNPLVSCQQAQWQLIKALNNCSIHDKLDGSSKAILSLDNWIKFTMNASDAKLLLLMRNALEDQFQIFLKCGHNDTTNNTAFYVQKLLNSLHTTTTTTAAATTTTVTATSKMTTAPTATNIATAISIVGNMPNVRGMTSGNGISGNSGISCTRNHHKTFNNRTN